MGLSTRFQNGPRQNEDRKEGCWLHHSLDEKNPRRTSPWNLYQTSRRRERDNYVPDVSAIEQDIIEVDKDTKEMLKVLDFGNIAGLQVTEPFTGAAIRSSVPGMRS